MSSCIEVLCWRKALKFPQYWFLLIGHNMEVVFIMLHVLMGLLLFNFLFFPTNRSSSWRSTGSPVFHPGSWHSRATGTDHKTSAIEWSFFPVIYSRSSSVSDFYSLITSFWSFPAFCSRFRMVYLHTTWICLLKWSRNTLVTRNGFLSMILTGATGKDHTVCDDGLP